MTLLHPLCPSLLWRMRFLILVLVIPLLVTVAIDENGPICQQAASEDSSNVSTQCDGGKQDNDMNERAQFDALVAWIRSLGGFVDDRLVLRRRDPDDSRSVRGMFVTDKVAQGEKLFYVPNEATIPSDQRPFDRDRCMAARTMARELELGSKSKYAPFVQILRDEHSAHPGPPSFFWSEQGRALLDKVLGRHLPPQNYMRYIEMWRFLFGCDPPLSDKDIILYSARVTSGRLVPLFVFVNHRLSPNFRFETNEQGHGAVTLQDIAKGEELFLSYGDCTHIVFQNYGFVEQFPQGWAFDFGVNGQGVDPQKDRYGRSGGDIVKFYLDKVMDSSHQNSDVHVGHNTSFSVTWVKSGGPPSKDVIELLRSELLRLGTLMAPYVGDGMNNNDGIPKEEKELILQYHRALTFAISHAISAATMESTATSV